MGSSSKPTGLMPQLFETPEQRKGPKDVKIEMCRNLSWNRDFFTNDGLLDAEELATITEATSDVKNQLQGIEEQLCRSMDSISTLGSDTTLEAKLFEQMEASTQNSSIKGSLSGEGDSKAKSNRLSPKGTKAAMAQASKVTGPRRGGPIALSPLGSSTSFKTEATRSSPLGNDKSSAARRRSTSSQTGKATADSSSKTPPGTRAKNKVSQLLPSNLSPKTSPTSSGSSSSTSDINRRSSRGSSSTSDGPRRSLANNEKPSATNARRKDEQRLGKTTSSIGIKNKPAPVSSHPSSPLGLSNSSPSRSPASSISQRPSQSSSPSTSTASSRGSRGGTTSVQNKSLNRNASAKSTSKTQPAPDQRGKQPAAVRSLTGSISRSSVKPTGRGIPSNKSGFIDEGRSYKSCLLTGLPEHDGTQTKIGSSKATKAAPSRAVAPSRTGAAAQTGLKPNPRKTTTTTTIAAVAAAATKAASSKKQESSGKAKGVKTLVLTSSEVMDIKGKLHALRVELSNQRQENMKMSPGGGSGKSSSNVYINSSSFQTKST